MPENPLLPQRKLKELHALMLRCRALDRAVHGKTKPQKSPAREAILAASAIHLEPGDLVFAEANDPVAASLAPAPKSSARKAAKKSSASIELNLPNLAAAVAAAHSLKPRDKNLVLAHTHENALEANWTTTLRFAHANHLPLLFLCTGSNGQKATPATKKNRDAFTWDAVSNLCAKLQIPLLPVDGEDAVALYRVFQESTLHARAGAAPGIIWAMLHPSSAALSRSQTPVARLEAYCRARNIKL